MEIAEEMEIEEEKPTPNHSTLKRFGLKNSIQTNFGDDYVFQIVSKYNFLSNFVFCVFLSVICSYGRLICDCNVQK